MLSIQILQFNWTSFAAVIDRNLNFRGISSFCFFWNGLWLYFFGDKRNIWSRLMWRLSIVSRIVILWRYLIIYSLRIFITKLSTWRIRFSITIVQDDRSMIRAIEPILLELLLVKEMWLRLLMESWWIIIL